MAREPSPEIDDELFNEVYGKAYAGPIVSTPNNAASKESATKRPLAGSKSDEEDEPPDPNAVPTDFTSREAKVWEAKAKATERNWKKRKEEEMICKICGESGHFTQGCPSTLGANRRKADFFERVPARDKRVRDLFSQKVVSKIEKDVGCKIKMDEKFLIVSGKDGQILAKGVDAVHKIIQDNRANSKSPSSPNRRQSKSPDVSTRASHSRCSESERSHSIPRITSRLECRGFNQERLAEDHKHSDIDKIFRGSPQAYAKHGAKGHPTRSKSPVHHTFGGDAFKTYDGGNRNAGLYKPNNWDIERHGTNSHSRRMFDSTNYPQTLEELEIVFKKESMDLGRARDQEEDEENCKHRKSLIELKENYMEKLALVRGMHAKQWEEFLQLGIQRQQQAHETAYNQPAYPDYDYIATVPRDLRSKYPHPVENYSAPRPDDPYAEFQSQRHEEDYGRTYRRY